jgi:hypothetical protein
MKINYDEGYISLLLLIISTLYLIYNLKKFSRVKKLIMRKGYFIEIAIVILWILAIFKFEAFDLLSKSPTKLIRLKRATMHGIVALIIATLAYLNLTTPTFWFVILIAFFIEMPLTGIY